MRRGIQTVVPARRRGAAMVFVLVLLLVISMFCASLIRATVSIYRQRQRDEDRAQTVRLAEAGLERVRQQSRRNADYAGETWQFRAGELGVERHGEVRIERLTDGDARTYRVTAEFPVDAPAATRMTLETTVTGKPSNAE